MTDHHDFGFDQHDFDGHDPAPFDDHSAPDDHVAWDDGHDYDISPDADSLHDAVPHDVGTHDVGTHEVGTHDDAGDVPPPEVAHPELSDISDLPEESPFPPAVDIDLPEPVDGFPWIDTGSLGVADIHAALDTTEPVHPAELAEYAGADLPPGVDPWAALADSDDPATAALAKWWQQN
jgi:hypothetical protein